jgi:hypothetical protein
MTLSSGERRRDTWEIFPLGSSSDRLKSSAAIRARAQAGLRTPCGNPRRFRTTASVQGPANAEFLAPSAVTSAPRALALEAETRLMRPPRHGRLP